MNRRHFGVLAGSALVVGPAFAAGTVDLDRLKLELRMGSVLQLFGFYDADEGVAFRLIRWNARRGEKWVSVELGGADVDRRSRVRRSRLAVDLAPRKWQAIAPVTVGEGGEGELELVVWAASRFGQRELQVPLVKPAQQG